VIQLAENVDVLRGSWATLLVFQLVEEPRLRETPVTADGAQRDFQYFGNLLELQPAKKSAIRRRDSDVDLVRQARRALHRARQGPHSLSRRDPEPEESETRCASAASFGALPLARNIDEDASHKLRRDCKEMSAVLPLNVGTIDQTQVGHR
jgi:hypothetical protein